MKTKLFITALLIFSILISCNRENKADLLTRDFQLAEVKTKESPSGNDNENKQIPVGKLSPFTADSGASPVQAIMPNIDWDKKIIKTATLRLEIKDFKKYNEHVHKTAKQYGAYIAQEEQNLSDEKSETVISIKVPVAQFEVMMNQLPGDDGKVLERKINTDDVTGEMVDIKSRLEAKKQMRLKYLEFLKQSKNMTEVLQVQGEINDIQEQIESASGRVAFLSHQAVFSTINLSFFQPMAGYRPTDATPSFLTRISSAFKNGISWIADLLVGFVAIWPLLLLLFAGYMSWKMIRPKKVIVQQVNSGQAI